MMKPLKTTGLSIVAALALSGAARADTLTVKVNVGSDEGTVRAALFRSQEDFDNDRLFAGVIQPAATGDMQLVFSGVKPGTYGIAVFQDKNRNEKLDRTLFNIPTEPFGFSRNPSIRFSAPTFEDFKFEFTGKATVVPVTLNGT